MKILLIQPESYYLPVGMAFISASLKRAGHVVDTCHVGKHEKFLIGGEGRYDFIGTGATSSQLRPVRDVLKIARDYGCKFLCGGPIISADPLVMAKMVGVDYGVIGEGEDTVVELLACLDQGKEPTDVRGIVYLKDKKYVMTPPRLKEPDMDTLPKPDLDGFDYPRLLDEATPHDVYYLDCHDYPREYPLITSRTCPFGCTFCFQPENRTYRVRDIDDVIEELREVVLKYRINIVTIYDELFHARDERLVEFSEKFKIFRETIPWEIGWSCQARVSRMTDELLATMRDSGCYMISYGIESYSEKVLDSMNKRIKREKIDNVVSSTIRHGMSVQGNFIFGDLAETVDTAQETLDYWEAHQDYGIVLYNLIPIPGARVHHVARERGLLGDLEDFLLNRYYEPINLTSMETYEYLEMRRRVFVSKLTYTGVKAQRPIKTGKRMLKVKCPHCEAENTYKNFPLSTFRIAFQTMTYCRSCRRRFYTVSMVYRVYAFVVCFVLRNVKIYNVYNKAYLHLRPIYRAIRNLVRGDLRPI